MKITVTDDCILCGVCEVLNPDIFQIDTKICINQLEANRNKEDCINIALMCPFCAIQIDDIF